MNFEKQISLTLYIHLPWCIRKCPYCDFNSHQQPEVLPESEYIDRLIEELDTQLPNIWGRRFQAIFFGGGTPSLFSPESLERLLKTIHSRIPFYPECEVTLEANPGTFEQDKFKGFRQAGINRLSLGIQSFNDEKLKTLGRVHGRDEALHAAQSARDAGFDNFNLDLMHGLPNQTVDEAMEDLQIAIDCNPTHLSWYQLTLEPNTYFNKYPPTLPEEDVLAEIQDHGFELLNKHHFQHYEVSAFAKDDLTCQHNLNYWQFGDYLGIGAGAHSKLTDMNQQVITRHWNVKSPKDYLHKKFIANQTTLTNDEAVFEFMLNAMRLTNGFDIAVFEEHCGLPFSSMQTRLDELKQKQLIEYDDQRVWPTEMGQRFLNDVVGAFLNSRSS